MTLILTNTETLETRPLQPWEYTAYSRGEQWPDTRIIALALVGAMTEAINANPAYFEHCKCWADLHDCFDTNELVHDVCGLLGVPWLSFGTTAPDRGIEWMNSAIEQAEAIMWPELVREPDEKMLVAIEGQVYAWYDNGKITDIYFSPSAGDAGFFGDGAKVAMFHSGETTIDVSDVHGQFWDGIRNYLESNDKIIWRE